MPGDLNQSVHLGVLPEGLNFTITAIEPSIPGDGWTAVFSHPDFGEISHGQYGNFNYISFPFTINLARLDGLIGNIKLRPDGGVWSSGQGGKVDVTFRLHGTTVAAGETIEVDDVGYISISSSEWKGLERPDYSNVTYYWPGGSPVNLSIEVPPTIAGMPDDAFFVFAACPEKREVGMNLTTHKDILAQVLDYAIRGILWINGKLVGWAVNPLK